MKKILFLIKSVFIVSLLSMSIAIFGNENHSKNESKTMRYRKMLLKGASKQLKDRLEFFIEVSAEKKKIYKLLIYAHSRFYGLQYKVKQGNNILINYKKGITIQWIYQFEITFPKAVYTKMKPSDYFGPNKGKYQEVVISDITYKLMK